MAADSQGLNTDGCAAYTAKNYERAEQLFEEAYTQAVRENNTRRMGTIAGNLKMLYESQRRENFGKQVEDRLAKLRVAVISDLTDRNLVPQLIDAAEPLLRTPVRPSKSMLKGQISHSTRVTPVVSSFRSGASCTKQKLKAITPDNVWHRIPNWFAGEWTSQIHVTWATFDYGQKQMIFVRIPTRLSTSRIYGFQVDKSGQIWDFDGKKFVTSHHDSTTAVMFNKHIEILSMDENHIAYKHSCDDIQLNSTNTRITRSYRTEAVTVAIRDTPDHTVFSESQKIFSEDGTPISVNKIIWDATRTDQFQQRAVFQNQNLRSLFEEFMQRNSMANLL